MALHLFTPSADRATTSWTHSGGGSFAADIDDYVGGGAKDDDSTFIAGPNNASTPVAQFDTPNTPADWSAPTGLDIIIAYRKESAGVSGTADTIGLDVGMEHSGGNLGAKTSISTNVGTSYVESTVGMTISGTPTQAQWDDGFIVIYQTYTQQGCADTTTKLRVSAVVIRATYAPVSLGPPKSRLLVPRNLAAARAALR